MDSALSERSAARLPALFVGHGSPMNALERNRYTDAWRALGVRIGKPRAILAISAHWYVRGTRVTAQSAPPTIHDFGGFPPELFAFGYPAPGDPALAARVRELLDPVPVALDDSWGLDHGTWSVLAHVFPQADVPVVQLSLDGTLPPGAHLDLARRLEPLRDEGVLIVGSGNVVHNLRRMEAYPGAPPFAWAERFEEYVRAAASACDAAPLVGYEAAGADADASVPTPEHYLPFLYAFGSAGRSSETIVRGIEAGSISMLSMQFA